MVDGDLDKILPLVRQAVELGADVIKADPCDDARQYHQVIEIAAGKPVLVRGGSKASDEEIITRTYELMRQGAAGIVYGRNVIQHEHPSRMVRALMALIHEDATPEQAMHALAEGLTCMPKRIINFGIIGCGMMGREFGSAVARWCHLLDQDVQPRIVGVCDANPAMLDWFTGTLR